MPPYIGHKHILTNWAGPLLNDILNSGRVDDKPHLLVYIAHLDAGNINCILPLDITMPQHV